MKKELFTQLPFYNTSKLDEIENRSKQQLKAESKDYYKISRPWYKRIFRASFPPMVASYYQTDAMRMQKDVTKRIEEIASNRQQWEETVPDYLDLIALKTGSETDAAEDSPVELEQSNHVSESAPAPILPMEPTMQVYPQLAPYLRAEMQFQDAIFIYGQQYAKLHYPVDYVPETINETLLILPTVKHNILAGKTLINIIMLFLIVGAGIAYESAVFGSIFGTLMNVTGVFKWLAVGSVLIMTKYFSFALYGTVKAFIQSHNRIRWRELIHSRIIQVLLVLLVVNTCVFGFLYFFANRDKATEHEIATIRKEVQTIETARWMNPEGFGDKQQSRLEELQQKVQVKEEQLEEKHPVLETLKGIAMTLSSGMVLLADSIVMIYLMLALKSYTLSRKLTRLRRSVNKDTIAANQRIMRLQMLYEKGFRIWSLFGQLRFIAKLRSGGTPSQAIFDPEEEKQPEYPFPLQQEY